MRRLALPVVLAPALLAGCATRTERPAGTLAELRDMRPAVEDVKVQGGLEQAMHHYRRFLEEAPETAMTPDAMRRLADLQIEKQFGIRGGQAGARAMAAPVSARVVTQPDAPVPAADGTVRESDLDFEQRTTASGSFTAPGTAAGGSPIADADAAGPLEAIAIYDRLLAEYPNYEHRDKVLYQKARAYDELGRTDEAIETMERLIAGNTHSEHYDEVQFRRGEYFFTRRRYRDAESAYSAITGKGASSSYYELALYKLGWTFYKQEFYEEALHKYMALLDHKVSIGYDFDQTHAEEDERRVADTYRVISLSFTNLGGPAAVQEYYATFGQRSYEDRVYNNLGDHYLSQLRYDDAAKAYRAFVALYPLHRAAPRFSMRVIDAYTQGGFPKLVLESKREFAATYGLQSAYWRHFTAEDAPEVLGYLKVNLKDLATHYHAEYQSTDDEREKRVSYDEARRWYGDYLDAFPADAESPAINYQFADLLLENKDYGGAATQYERTAYEYARHPQAADAGYAAVFAHREALKLADADARDTARGDTVASSLRFAETFPEHEHAAPVLGAAADDMYEMKDYGAALTAARRLIDTYPNADGGIRRAAWLVVAHGSFELAEYTQAEEAYTEVLAVTPEQDAGRAALVDNLAASIYKQGELASDAEDYRAAADHFLRIKTAAPTSAIRPAAEYDAGAALIRLQDWPAAVQVLDAFRTAFPDHELRLEATKQIAHAHRESGQLSHAATEYEQIAGQASDPALRSEALLLAGDLYEQANARERALATYVRYVDEFPRPVGTAVETRLKVAEMYKAANDDTRYHAELEAIVRADREAGAERTGRTRTVAGRAALVLAEQQYRAFLAVRLRQPFETSLQKKQERMDSTIDAMSSLVGYEIAEVTAAATYYMAETYLDFSRALLESERPADLKPAELSEFELALDEEAFPFEEKAIEVHEKNIELLRAGVLNEWTEKSLGQLTTLMPGRYARQEASSGFIGPAEDAVEAAAVDATVDDAAAGDGTGTPAAEREPISVDEQVVTHATPE